MFSGKSAVKAIFAQDFRRYVELLAVAVNTFNFGKTRPLCKIVVDCINPLFSDSNSSMWQKLSCFVSSYISAVTSK